MGAGITCIMSNEQEILSHPGVCLCTSDGRGRGGRESPVAGAQMTNRAAVLLASLKGVCVCVFGEVHHLKLLG